jgi:serine/threonine protein kinase/WD40 repeat protein
MTADPNRVKDLFLAAAELPAPDRPAFLAGACGGDGELRAAVERLLAAHAAPDSRIDRGAGEPTGAGATGTFPPGAPPADDRPAGAPGQLLAGRYKLAEPIGEGGMGAVWMAQQVEPVRRAVAVKLIKAGMDSKAVLARFEAERQALALMDHPNIAKVLDAGLTDDGRPFFVMELVKGVPITQFCDARRLTPRQRLELFVPVCQAIQHAHQKGVIHRDIKPSNVLVALYDDRPVPKVIDFGVAKAAGQPLTEQTILTGFGAVIGTPEYMSPEQASFNQLDIDTRSDVYALGVLLYELLTGTTPFPRKELERAGLLEILRVIREQEPAKPSTRLSSPGTSPEVAAARGSDPGRLAGLVRGELDWIVMRALEKDRGRRYETATSFAADVQRYLAGDPVQAAPPGAAYRLRKLARRHRGPLVAGGVVLTALVLGVVGTSLGMVRAIDERKQAVKAGDQLRDARDELWSNLYAARCTLISNAWEAKQYDLVRELLAKQLPADGQRDLRGFEWYYLDRQLHADLLTVPLPPAHSLFATISPDGSRLVRVTNLGAEAWLRAFDTTTGKEVFAHRLPSLPNGPVSFSPDGKRLVLSVFGEQDKGQPVREAILKMWDAETGTEVATVRGLAPRGQPLAGPEGRFVAWGEPLKMGPTPLASTMRVRLLDPATGKDLDSALKEIPQGQLQALSPDGRYLAMTVYKHETVGPLPVVVGQNPGPAPIMPFGTMEVDVKVLEIATGKQMMSFQASDVRTATFSPDSKRLLVAGKTLIVKDVASGDRVLEARHTATTAAFSPDGSRIAFRPEAFPDAFDARILDAATGRTRCVLQGHDGGDFRLAFSRDGTRLITAGNDRVKHWDATADDRLAALPLGLGPVGSTSSPNGTRRALLPLFGVVVPAAVVGMPQVPANAKIPEEPIQVWGQGEKPIFTSPPVSTGNKRDLTFSPDDRLLLYRRTFTVVEGDESRLRWELRVWEIDTGKEVLKVVEKGRLVGVAFSRDGRRLAALVEGDGREAPVPPEATPTALKAWDTDSGRELFTRALLNGDRGQVAISPDGKRASVLVRDGDTSLRLTVLDAESGQEFASAGQPLPAGWQWDGWVSNAPLVLSPREALDAFLLANVAGGVSQSTVVRVWDPASGRTPVDIKSFNGAVRALAFSPDGRRLAALSSNTLHLLDPYTGAELLRLTLEAQTIAFAPDSTLWIGFRSMETAAFEMRRLDGTPRPGANLL